MNNEMSLREQIHYLNEMKTYLEKFCNEMLQTMNYFQDQITGLRQEGFSVETSETYIQRYYTPAKSDVETVVSDIRKRHIDYINRVIERLERAASKGR